MKIPVSTKDDSLPALALDARNTPHIVWTRHRVEPAACGVGYTDIGTYYATNASGRWTAHRITRKVGETSLQYDNLTGRPHVLVTGLYGLWYYTTTPSGQWTETRVVHKRWPSTPLLRLDPATGTLLAVYLISSDTGSTRI